MANILSEKLLSKEQRNEKQRRVTSDTPLKTVPQIELILVNLPCNNLSDVSHLFFFFFNLQKQEVLQFVSH